MYQNVQTVLAIVNNVVRWSDLPEVGDSVRQRSLCGDVCRVTRVVVHLFHDNTRSKSKVK